MTSPNAVQVWEALKAWYAEHLPEVVTSLNPGASEEALGAFTRELAEEGLPGLPVGLRDVYGQNDGQARASSGFFFGLEFLRLEEVRRNWQGWCEHAKDRSLDDLNENSRSYPQGAIQLRYANHGWIPFAFDWGGNHLGIDLTPGPAGRVGQVINFGRDEDHKFVLAPSLEAFLAWQLRALQRGNFRIVTESFDGQPERLLYLRQPDDTHLLDAVPKLFGPKPTWQDTARRFLPLGQRLKRKG